MIKNKYVNKATEDLFYQRFKWTYFFFGIILTVTIGKNLITGITSGEATDGFFVTSFVSTNIYMFVLGILSYESLKHLIGNGVTRKNYFLGNTLANVGIAITITIATAVVHVLEKMILKWIQLPYAVNTINDVELTNDIIGDTIQLMILSPFVDPNDNIFLAMGMFFINILFMSILGWFVGISFYRFHYTIGIVSVIIIIGAEILKDNLLRIVIDLPSLGYFTFLDNLPKVAALLIIFVMFAILLYALRGMTKRITVKL